MHVQHSISACFQRLYSVRCLNPSGQGMGLFPSKNDQRPRNTSQVRGKCSVVLCKVEGERVAVETKEGGIKRSFFPFIPSHPTNTLDCEKTNHIIRFPSLPQHKLLKHPPNFPTTAPNPRKSSSWTRSNGIKPLDMDSGGKIHRAPMRVSCDLLRKKVVGGGIERGLKVEARERTLI